jgi:protein associated with RNAse G/E
MEDEIRRIVDETTFGESGLVVTIEQNGRESSLIGVMAECWNIAEEETIHAFVLSCFPNEKFEGAVDTLLEYFVNEEKLTEMMPSSSVFGYIVEKIKRDNLRNNDISLSETLSMACMLADNPEMPVFYTRIGRDKRDKNSGAIIDEGGSIVIGENDDTVICGNEGEFKKVVTNAAIFYKSKGIRIAPIFVSCMYFNEKRQSCGHAICVCVDAEKFDIEQPTLNNDYFMIADSSDVALSFIFNHAITYGGMDEIRKQLGFAVKDFNEYYYRYKVPIACDFIHAKCSVYEKPIQDKNDKKCSLYASIVYSTVVCQPQLSLEEIVRDKSCFAKSVKEQVVRKIAESKERQSLLPTIVSEIRRVMEKGTGSMSKEYTGLTTPTPLGVPSKNMSKRRGSI